MITHEGKTYLSIRETAKRLNLVDGTVRNYINLGRIGSVKVGARRFVPESEIAAYLQEFRDAPVTKKSRR